MISLKVVETTDQAVYLARQFVMYTLHTRLFALPYLEEVERQWITFQLLSAVVQCHSSGGESLRS